MYITLILYSLSHGTNFEFTVVVIATGNVEDAILSTSEGSGNVQLPTEGSDTTISGNVLYIHCTIIDTIIIYYRT